MRKNELTPDGENIEPLNQSNASNSNRDQPFHADNNVTETENIDVPDAPEDNLDGNRSITESHTEPEPDVDKIVINGNTDDINVERDLDQWVDITDHSDTVLPDLDISEIDEVAFSATPDDSDNGIAGNVSYDKEVSASSSNDHTDTEKHSHHNSAVVTNSVPSNIGATTLGKNPSRVTSENPITKSDTTNVSASTVGKKRNGFRTAAIVGGVFALAAIGFSGYAIVANETQEEPEPQVTMVPVGEAQGYAATDDTNEDLCSRFTRVDCEVTWETSAGVDRGYLVSQSSPAGSDVEEGSTVTLAYSSGPASSEFPEVEGRELESIEEDLYEMGIVVSEVSEVSSPVSKGLVVSASADPGDTLKNGDEVSLQVSNGSVEIPDWTGEPREVVEAEARNLGIDVAFREEESDQPSGTALSQSPSAGRVIASEGVVVTLAKNFDSQKIVVPEVIGLSADEAQAELASAGFRHINTVVVENSRVTEPQVTQVVPGEGEDANSENDIVIIFSTPDAGSASPAPSVEASPVEPSASPSA